MSQNFSRKEGGSSSSSLSSDVSTNIGTPTNSDYGNRSKRRSLSVTFADRQPRVGSIDIIMGDTFNGIITHNGSDASTSTTVSPAAKDRSTLATYHYVESYKDYNRRNSTRAVGSTIDGCMGVIKACLGLLPTHRRYRRFL